MVVLCAWSRCDGGSHIQGENLCFQMDLESFGILLIMEEFFMYLTLS